MSYSRWSHSNWYTFWCISPYPEEEQTKENAIFEICGITSFSAKELRENLEECLKQVKEICTNADETDINELKVYIKKFLSDVDARFSDDESDEDLLFFP
jgi:spore maturation protein CgeB